MRRKDFVGRTTSLWMAYVSRMREAGGEKCDTGGDWGMDLQRRALAAKPPQKSLSKMARKSPVDSDRFGSMN